MYKRLIRPALFLFPPETVHSIVIRLIKFLHGFPGMSSLFRSLYTVKNPALKRTLLGITFDNPVGLAAGFDKNAEVYNLFADFGFSHIEVGTVTPKGQPGNPKPRSFRIPRDKGLINRMGFNNEGVDAMLKKLSKKRKPHLVVGGNIGKNTLTPNKNAVDDYVTTFQKLYGKVDYFVVNVSCPNISDLHELQDQEGLETILGKLSEIRKQQLVYSPILLKISPDLNNKQIDTTLSIVKKYGIDGIVATNTTVSRENLLTSKERIDKIANGGLSGAPITKRSLEVVKYISEQTGGSLPIIGVGGIMTSEDALNMIRAGASLVQVYTGFIYNGPGFVKKINKAILRSGQ
ncbi:quinone-dependent dihydroorotate dehydrogenase [Bacteroidota bacterium]